MINLGRVLVVLAQTNPVAAAALQRKPAIQLVSQLGTAANFGKLRLEAMLKRANGIEPAR